VRSHLLKRLLYNRKESPPLLVRRDNAHLKETLLHSVEPEVLNEDVDQVMKRGSAQLHENLAVARDWLLNGRTVHCSRSGGNG